MQNDSTETIRYLRLDVAKIEKFMIFDLAPGATVTLSAFPLALRLSDFDGFNCYATFETGIRRLEGSGAFKPIDGQERSGHFLIKISTNEITIDSSDFRRVN